MSSYRMSGTSSGRFLTGRLIAIAATVLVVLLGLALSTVSRLVPAPVHLEPMGPAGALTVSALEPAHGRCGGGEKVIVRGSGFQKDDVVVFGTRRVEDVEITPDSIVVPSCPR